MARFKTLDDMDVASKRVLVRVDFNVPMSDGQVTDATRIERAAPTLKELAAKGARVIVLSHFGRPKGKVESSMSLQPLVAPLSASLGGKPVAFAPACVGEEAEAVVAALQDGDVALLENLRFHAGEEKPADDPAFIDALAALGDLYVNDAFSCSHRAHASITGLADKLPAYAGRLMQAELEALEGGLGNPARPVAALVGGAKVSTKLDVLTNLTGKVDVLIIGGGMANTFLHAQGIDIGKSLCEKDLADTARSIMAEAEGKRCKIVLPTDGAIAKEFAENAPHDILPVGDIPADGMMLDVGPTSAQAAADALGTCKTLVWNGPMGAFEIPPFDAATNKVAQAAAKLTGEGQLMSVAGGGDTVAALAHAGVLEQFSYVSTAGGAFLEWLEGKELPGVASLRTA